MDRPNPSIRYPRLALGLAGSLTVSVLLAQGWSLRRTHGLVQTFQHRYRVLETACADIRYLDEVLTMSARMAASSGDLAWAQRYDAHVGLLDVAIAQVEKLSTQEQALQANHAVAQANQSLIALESQSFGLVAKGHSKLATKLLAGPKYAANKLVYSRAVASYLDGLSQHISSRMHKEIKRGQVGLTALLLSLPLLFGMWFTVGRSLKRYARERELALVEAMSQRSLAEQAHETKVRFIANLSHEIRTPMHSIVGYSELLLDSGLSAGEHLEYTALIRADSARLLELVNDLLGLSSLDSKQRQLEPCTFAPSALSQRLRKKWLGPAAAKGLRLTFSHADSLPDSIHLDQERLLELLNRLLDNAIKFTPKGSVDLNLCATAGEPPMLIAKIIDTGIGIPTKRLARLLDPFTQADESELRSAGGVGIGLHLAKNLAELMGGEITVESTPGAGSQFTLALPYAKPTSPSPALPEDPKPAVTGPTRSGHILVVDDVGTNRLLCRRILESAGHTVDTAADGREALNKVAEATRSSKPYDIILMDLMMPILDGLSATRELRAKGYSSTILAFTADAQTETRIRSQEAGCDGILTKPAGKQQLLSEIDLYLGSARARQKLTS